MAKDSDMGKEDEKRELLEAFGIYLQSIERLIARFPITHIPPSVWANLKEGVENVSEIDPEYGDMVREAYKEYL